MDLLLVPAPALLALGLTRWATHRRACTAGACVGLAAWLALYGAGLVAPWSAAAVVAAAFLGALTATARATGLAEENAAPPAAVRERVLAAHRGVVPRREPPGKRAFDVALAAAGIVVTLPVWLVVAVLVWLEEPGPILFTKNSVGRGGVTFRQFKFRSMRYGAEESTGPAVSCPADPRTLRVGRGMRRWHLDELPELVNVLAGTMSLVGPRPLRTVLVAGYLDELPEFALRHAVKPGIACVAQIERYRMPPADRLHKDLRYIARMSVRHDIALLCRAVVTTVRGQRDRTEAAACPPRFPDRPPGRRAGSDTGSR